MVASTVKAALRIASRPGPEHQNPYFRLFYGSLQELGIEYAGLLEVDDQWLRTHAAGLDAVHVHWPEWLWRQNGKSRVRRIVGLYRYLALARRLGLVRVWTVHNLPPHEWQLADLPGLWLLAREIDVFICHSRQSQRDVRRWLRPARMSRSVVMSMGNFEGAYPPPSAPPATIRMALRLPADKKLVGVIGQIRPYKGLDTALVAIERMDPDVHLVIAGRPVGDVTRLRARALELADRATLIDRDLSDQELADLMSCLQVAWLPYTRITGSAALLLALTEGLPVVASDLPFFREVLGSEPKAGKLVASGNAGALADATRELLSGPAPEQRASARALAARFRWTDTVRDFANVLQRMVIDRRLRHAE